MSLKPYPIQPVPEETVRVARAAFPKGNPYLILRDELGTLFHDEDFIELFPVQGQPGLPPWRLALVSVLQFRENLSDRQAAEAVRARIDWKYLLGLELTDAGFDFSVLSEFRTRLLAGEAEEQLLERLLEECCTRGLVKARGRQRTDSTHVLANIRELNRLELVAETLRAALNEIATLEPDWLREQVPVTWYERYGRRIEDSRLPKTEAERQAYAQRVGQDGFSLLDWLEAPGTPADLKALPKVEALQVTWQRHYRRDDTASGEIPAVHFKPPRELTQALKGIESPYEPEARFRSKSGMHWTGYMVHLTETCDEDRVHLITHVKTTPADVHEAMCTADIHQALAEKDLPPDEHLVDAGYVDADLLVQSQTDYSTTLVGPTRQNSSWQSKLAGGYDSDQFLIDWEAHQVRCPQGKDSTIWNEYQDSGGSPYITVMFKKADCGPCTARLLCTRSKKQARVLKLHPRPQHEALQAARDRLATEEGRLLYAQRAGVEGTLSQGVRAFGLRRSRYRGLAKTHLQQVVTAVAINLDRLAAWLRGKPRAITRISRFAALAP
jgi:transposase